MSASFILDRSTIAGRAEFADIVEIDRAFGRAYILETTIVMPHSAAGS